MGCIASQEPQSTNSPDDLDPATKFDQNQSTSNSTNFDTPSVASEAPKFLGVLEKPPLLVRDQFHSKYDGSLMYKWRKVDILRVDEDDHSKILIHFQGWADTFDQWMDLHTELHKIAPIMLLTKTDCSAGKALTEEELQITRDYLLTGQFRAQQVIADVSRPANRRENSITSLPIEFFTEGKMLDILDIFVAVSSKEKKKKWRKARIINVNDRKIRISYIGWDTKYDETLDIFDNADRISPLGSKTTEQSARSLSALKESPHKQPSARTSNMGNGAQTNTTVEVEESSSDEEEAEADTEINNEDAEIISTQSSSVVTNTGGFFQSLTRLIGGGSSTDKTSSASTSAAKSSKKVNDPGDATSTQNGQKKKRKKGKHGKYSSYEEARADVIKKSAEEKAAELEKERKFLEALGRNRLHVIEMEGDGNCLFRAISHQLYLTEDNHEILRRNCVEHLLAHKNRFCHFCADDYDEHIREMAKVGTWGDELEIRAMEEILDRHITIYSSEASKLDEPINTNIEEEAILKGVTPIMLSYHGQNHYNSIFDEKFPLPLSLRGTSLLLQSRMGLIDGKNGLPTSSNKSNFNSNVEKFYNNAVGPATSAQPPSSSRKSLSRTSSGAGSTGNVASNSGNFYYNGAMPQPPAAPYVAYSAPIMYQVASPGGVVPGTMPMLSMAGGGAYGGYALSNGTQGSVPMAGGMMVPAPAGYMPMYGGSMDTIGIAVASGKGVGPTSSRMSYNGNASGGALSSSGATTSSLSTNSSRPSSYNHGHYSSNNNNAAMNTSGINATGMNSNRYQQPGSMNSNTGSGRQTGDYYG